MVLQVQSHNCHTTRLAPYNSADRPRSAQQLLVDLLSENPAVSTLTHTLFIPLTQIPAFNKSVLPTVETSSFWLLAYISTVDETTSSYLVGLSVRRLLLRLLSTSQWVESITGILNECDFLFRFDGLHQIHSGQYSDARHGRESSSPIPPWLLFPMLSESPPKVESNALGLGIQCWLCNLSSGFT